MSKPSLHNYHHRGTPSVLPGDEDYHPEMVVIWIGVAICIVIGAAFGWFYL